MCNDNNNSGGTTSLAPGVQVQNKDPKLAALGNAYYNYLGFNGFNPAHIGMRQSYAIWDIICQQNPGLCPGGMAIALWRQFLPGGEPIPSGTIFAVSDEFAPTGGAVAVTA
jgi:hypothetical protein